MVEYERLSEEETVNVLYEFDTEGDEDIFTQVLKLSDETWRVPEHEVSLVLVVTVVGFMVSEKVTEMVELTETDVSESDGEVDETVGGVVSEFWVYSSFSSPHEMMVRLRNEIRIMYKTFFIFSTIPKLKYYYLCIREPYVYHNLCDLTRMWGFYLEGDWLWRISGC